ncbi:MAG: hypothetical protein LBC60_02475 [Spirochaetaceae bacterium]|jgi:hypothetical protein|nr:hypothetical protein [Spirochaetaceae bacterium]
MYKKSLFWGAAALALLAVYAFVGCSNPSSGSTEYVTQASSDYPFPADTVFVNTRAALNGLLNDYNAETNKVINIAYTGTITADLIIPSGKTVYLTADLSGGTTGNITVREGARLVLVGDFLAGHIVPTPASTGYLLVRGTVEVFRSLTVKTDARDVADYSVENVIEPGRNTVIGEKVTILPGAVLTLDVTDILPPNQSLPNKFTPAQAWAAAGKGHLVIGLKNKPGDFTYATATDILSAHAYTVQELLTGVYPSATRSYTVASARIATETLPSLIPAGAYILTSATPRGSDGNTLTVNGSLITEGTLNDITKLEVGNGGSLVLTEPANELLRSLEELRLGPGASFEIDSNTDVSLESLTALFLGDGSSIDVPGTNVTFKDGTPVKTTLGKDVAYRVGMSASAKVDTVITKDASLVGGSILTVYPGSTFTLQEGVTFTVDDGSTFDISNLTPPAADAASPVTINGAIEITEGSAIVGPSFPTVQANPDALFKTIGLGTDGKVVLNYGADFYFSSTTGQKFVGSNGDTATYEWADLSSPGAPPTDGAQIEINSKGLIIRDIDEIVTHGATITIAAPGAGILKNQSLTLERGVTLVITDVLPLYLFGDTEANGGGAKLLGQGKVQVGTAATSTTITGGDFGWQAIGDNIAITPVSPNNPALISVSAATPVSPTTSTTLKALGLGAAINVTTADVLNLYADITIDLNGGNLRKVGEITIANGGKITFAADTDTKIVTGASPATNTTPVTLAVTNSTVTASGIQSIAVLGLTSTASTQIKASTTGIANTTATPPTVGAGKLVSLIGGTAVETLTTTALVSISSETVTEPSL